LWVPREGRKGSKVFAFFAKKKNGEKQKEKSRPCGKRTGGSVPLGKSEKKKRERRFVLLRKKSSPIWPAGKKWREKSNCHVITEEKKAEKKRFGVIHVKHRNSDYSSPGLQEGGGAYPTRTLSGTGGRGKVKFYLEGGGKEKCEKGRL